VALERWQRCQLETERSVEAFVKAPIISFPNPAQKKARKRGVRYRIVYERAVIEDPEIKPYLDDWVAGGEEVRIYDGELPYKLSLFDRELVLFFLARRSGPASAMFIRHALFARSTGVLFDYFWHQAKPLLLKEQKTDRASTKTPVERALNTGHPDDRVSPNGRRGHYARKVKPAKM
jgi:hypothetical protein